MFGIRKEKGREASNINCSHRTEQSESEIMGKPVRKAH